MAVVGKLSLVLDAAMNRLLTQAMLALAQAELDDALIAIEARLLRCAAAFRLERLPDAPPGCLAGRIGLAPFAELALLEGAAVARDAALDSATKTQRVCEALDLGGY